MSPYTIEWSILSRPSTSFFWRSVAEGKPHCDLLACEEGCFEERAWVRDRRLNGDETTMPSFGAPTLLRLKTFCYA